MHKALDRVDIVFGLTDAAGHLHDGNAQILHEWVLLIPMEKGKVLVMNEAIERTVAQLPPSGQKIRVIFDTDIDNEIDDLYAIALAMFSPDRFVIEGFSAAHFAQREGSDSIERSYALLQQMIEVAGVCSAVPIVRGSHPMRYSLSLIHI